MHEFECRKQFDELNLDVVIFVKLSPSKTDSFLLLVAD